MTRVSEKVEIGMAGNSNLGTAAKAKKDEFYTQLHDIEDELKYYKDHFEGKTVLCNCDDPFESNFFKYFVLNFNHLGLKKLIATSYAGSIIAGTQFSYDIDKDGQMTFSFDKDGKLNQPVRHPYKAVVTSVYDISESNGVEMLDVAELFKSGENQLTELEGDGDFRSKECIEVLKEADIVVTNPPFSLFREYVATLIEYDKKFIIIGNQNAITYKEFFPLLKDNKVWLGYHSGHTLFAVPDTYDVPDFYNLEDRQRLRSNGYIFDENGKLWRNLGNICWFTNLDIKKRHEELILVRRYNPETYPKYDNYNAINVDKVAEIPYDYDRIMGVPISFMDKYDPEQFEILGLTSGRNEFDECAWPSKRYINAIQVNKDGSKANGSKANTRATILLDKIPSDTVYYTADNAEKPFQIVYARILIRNKHPEQPKEVR